MSEYNATQVRHGTNISYRQLQYWTKDNPIIRCRRETDSNRYAFDWRECLLLRLIPHVRVFMTWAQTGRTIEKAREILEDFFMDDREYVSLGVHRRSGLVILCMGVFRVPHSQSGGWIVLPWKEPPPRRKPPTRANGEPRLPKDNGLPFPEVELSWLPERGFHITPEQWRERWDMVVDLRKQGYGWETVRRASGGHPVRLRHYAERNGLIWPPELSESQGSAG